MTSHRTGTREEWLAARGDLLAKEKDLTRRGDQLAAERRGLPWVPIAKQYRFGTDAGPRTLADSHGSDYAYDLELACPVETARGWLAGGVPPVAAKNARECGTEPAVYVSEQPVMNSYTLEDGTVYLTYSTTARGLEFMMVHYGLLDLTPLGRNEENDAQLWLRRHDEYDGP
jgi:predicted dithiol-disulfide oxidoreductase (DUF899 family)